jgi:predicted transcriptional regulator
MLHGKTLQVAANAPVESAVAAFKALASEPRWRILQLLAQGGQTINQVAETLCVPPSTVAAHIKILEQAGLIHTELEAASHGLQKVCTRTYDNVIVELPRHVIAPTTVVEVAMPIGAYTNFEIRPTCGIASSSALIGYLDDPLSYYEPEHISAGLLWFRSGFLEYTFPNRLPESATLVSLQLSMEICSEAPLHNPNWPSDITLWINDCEIGSWTCPGDFGGQRGALTPSWWGEQDSQYGLLKRWLITRAGSFIDGLSLGSVNVAALGIDGQRVIRVRLGVKPDALHVGGINLFGHEFGNYPQDILLRLEYLPGQRTESER